MEYGVALHSPIRDNGGGQGRLYVFLEALGRYRYDETADRPAVWEMIPGMHWRMNDNWWVSGAYIFPVNTTRTDSGLWHLSCSFRF